MGFLENQFSILLSRHVKIPYLIKAPQLVQTVKNLPAMQETWVQSLGWEDPRKEGVGHFSSILVWKLPTDRGTGGLQSMGVTKSQTQLSD